ncbi:glycosyl transferase family 1 [Pseudoalteromonas luteoviolacea]|nr:glycosyl transferase family 1 [Pseudoalteromonas luteoviolacea]
MEKSIQSSKKKVFVIGALPRSLVVFRGELIAKLASQYEVICMANSATSEEIQAINSLGAQYIDFPVKRNGLNPLEDLRTLFFLIKTFRAHNPDIVLAYTIKPVVWGGIAAIFNRGVQFNALITGLGFAFQRGGFKRNLLTKGVKALYRLALKNAHSTTFQNPDNRDLFVSNKLVRQHKCHLVNGSGVDLSYYEGAPLPTDNRFLLVARLLGEKGVREYVEAAKIVKKQFPDAIFDIVGPADPSPDGIDIFEVEQWHNAGIINYHGETSDVRPYYEACSVYVLPSYHEGLPRSVLEAMAIGRPILTTEVPGCKETVVNGENGWLVEKASVEQLADKMIWFIEHQEQWPEMARKSRRYAVDKFDVHKVNADIMTILGLN